MALQKIEKLGWAFMATGLGVVLQTFHMMQRSDAWSLLGVFLFAFVVGCLVVARELDKWIDALNAKPD